MSTHIGFVKQAGLMKNVVRSVKNLESPAKTLAKKTVRRSDMQSNRTVAHVLRGRQPALAGAHSLRIGKS